MRTKPFIFNSRGVKKHNPVEIVYCQRDIGFGAVHVLVHWIEVNGEKVPEVSIKIPLTYEIHGRWFVGQGYTDRLPHVFEALPPDNVKMELAEVCG